MLFDSGALWRINWTYQVDTTFPVHINVESDAVNILSKHLPHDGGFAYM